VHPHPGRRGRLLCPCGGPVTARSESQVLFVCLGNICRSPLAEGAFRALLAAHGLDGRVSVDSAGTSSYHAGEAPDPRSVAEARRRGVDIAGQRSRPLSVRDFEAFRWVVVMDGQNLADAADLRATCDGPRARLVPFMDFVPPASRGNYRGVPDPYHGGPDGFREVWDLLAAGMEPLLDAVLADAAP
jgi:protein-tyrosine phosphatase